MKSIGTETDDKCLFCRRTDALHTHHVVGRIGPDKDKPENKIRLCAICHHKWHTARQQWMEGVIYTTMKEQYGDRFPIKVNGHPRKTKWIQRIEDEIERERKKDDGIDPGTE